MKTDPLKQYVALRDSLLQEKAGLEQRLSQISQALSGEASPPVVSSRGLARRALPRTKNKLSLKQAITQVTRAKPLSKPEILAAIKKIGYRFATDDPMNSLGSVLYVKGQFKNENGRFTPAR